MGSTSDFLHYDEDRYQKALQLARSAFWSAFTGSFPEMELSDLDPFSGDLFQIATEQITRIWMINNYPLELPPIESSMQVLREHLDAWWEKEQREQQYLEQGDEKPDDEHHEHD